MGKQVTDSNKPPPFFKKHGRVVTFIGALIVFATSKWKLGEVKPAWKEQNDR